MKTISGTDVAGAAGVTISCGVSGVLTASIGAVCFKSIDLFNFAANVIFE